MGRPHTRLSDQTLRLRRKSRNRKIVFAFFVFLGLIVVLESPITRLRKIVVVGNRGIPTHEVIAASDLTKGISLWNVSASSVKKNIIRKLDLVQNVNLHMDWWTGTATLNLTEKHVVAVYMANGHFYNLLNDGVVYQSTNSSEATAFPLVTEENRLPQIGQYISPQVSELCRQLSGVSVNQLVDISELHVSSDGTLQVYFDNGYVAMTDISQFTSILPKIREAVAYFSSKGFAPGIVNLTGAPPYQYTPFSLHQP